MRPRYKLSRRECLATTVVGMVAVAGCTGTEEEPADQSAESLIEYPSTIVIGENEMYTVTPPSTTPTVTPVEKPPLTPNEEPPDSEPSSNDEQTDTESSIVIERDEGHTTREEADAYEAIEWGSNGILHIESEAMLKFKEATS